MYLLQTHWSTGSFPTQLWATGSVRASQNLTGATTAGARNRAIGKLRVSGSAQKLFEAMSEDRGAVAAGFKDNFGLGRLSIDSFATVRLQDNANNAPGAGAEAMYVDALETVSGTTLDLNGLKLYARIANIQGTVTGGTITTVPDTRAHPSWAAHVGQHLGRRPTR